MVAAVSLYDNWLDIKYQDSMEGVPEKYLISRDLMFR